MAYNVLSGSRRFLKRHRKGPPSLTIHVHPGFVKIENTNGVFLSDGPVRQLVEAVYSERLRADMIEALEQAGVQYYEGQLIVDVHEYRTGVHGDAGGLLDSIAGPPSAKPSAASLAATSGTRVGRTYTPSQHTLAASTSGLKPPGSGGMHGAKEPNKYRVALSRTSQTLWTELGMLFADAGITQEQAVALEGRILTITTPPLCLDPSFEVTRIANHMLNKTMTQERPAPPRRKAADLEKEAEVSREDQLELARERERLLYGDPLHLTNKNFAPSFGRYNYIVQWRTDRDNLKTHPAPVDPHSTSTPAAPQSRPQSTVPSVPSVASLPKIAKAKVPKRDAPSPASSGTRPPPPKRKKQGPGTNVANARGDYVPSQSGTPNFANFSKPRGQCFLRNNDSAIIRALYRYVTGAQAASPEPEMNPKGKDVDDTLSQLSSEAADLRSSRLKLEAELAMEESDRQRLKRENAARKRKEQGGLTDEEAATIEITQILSEIEEVEKQTWEQSETLNTERALCESLEEQLAKLQTDIALIEEGKQASRESLTAETLIRETQEEVDALNSAVAHVKQAITDLEDAQDEIAAAIDGLTRDIKKAREPIDDLRRQVEAKEKELEKISVDMSRVEQVDTRYKKAVSDTDAAKKRIQAARQESAHYEEEISVTEERMDDAGRFDGYKSEVKELALHLKSIEDRIEDATREKTELENELVGLLAESDMPKDVPTTSTLIAIKDAQLRDALAKVDAPQHFKDSMRYDVDTKLCVLEEFHFEAFVDRVLKQLKAIAEALEDATKSKEEKRLGIEQQQKRRAEVQAEFDRLQARLSEVHPDSGSVERSTTVAKNLDTRIKRKVKAALHLKTKAEKLSRDILNLQLEQFADFEKLLREELEET